MLDPWWVSLFRRLFKPHPLRRWTAARRALPDFLIIGAMRAGTTALYDFLSQHPGVIPAIKKEIHYFDLAYPRGQIWYRAHFPLSSRRRGRLTGEATPYYLFHPHAPRRAAETVPRARLIAILRHPVERAYSHYWHIRRLGREPLPFEQAISREQQQLPAEEAKLQADERCINPIHQHFSYLARGVYAPQLARWLSFFPREQLLVLESQALEHDLDRQARRLLDFLGLPFAPLRMNRQLNRASYPPMNEATRRQLLAYFQPYNAQLVQLLQMEFPWHE